MQDLAGLWALLVADLQGALGAGPDVLGDVQELRLRLGQRVRVRRVAAEQALPLEWDEALMQAQLMRFTENSLYAYEEQLRQGFVTLPGGHRVGLCGRAWYSAGQMAGLRDISSMNVRVARAVPGVAQAFWPLVVDAGRVRRCLIAAGPGVGKTTLLRDLARGLADGVAGVPAQNVGIADERQELAAAYMGRAMLPVGARCDVISGCAKADALVMLLRCMAPDVLVTDEIGTAADACALRDALNCGVAVLASAHAADYAELLGRPALADLLLAGYFERVIFVERRGAALLPRAVYDSNGERLI